MLFRSSIWCRPPKCLPNLNEMEWEPLIGPIQGIVWLTLSGNEPIRCRFMHEWPIGMEISIDHHIARLLHIDLVDPNILQINSNAVVVTRTHKVLRAVFWILSGVFILSFVHFPLRSGTSLYSIQLKYNETVLAKFNYRNGKVRSFSFHNFLQKIQKKKKIESNIFCVLNFSK